MTMAQLNLESSRKQFPALSQNPTFVFADNAGGSQILGSVAQRITDYLVGSNVQMSDYPYSHNAAAAVANGKAAAAVFAGTQTENIMFGSSATQLCETLTRMIEATVVSRRNSHNSDAWLENDEIIITNADHETNRGAWLRLADRLKLTIKVWQVTELHNENGQESSASSNVGLDCQDLFSLVTERTRIVAFTGSSNVLGSHWSDKKLREITQEIRKRSQGNAFVAVDAVAFAPHMRLRPEEWGVDFVLWSWYKVFGPHLASLYLSNRAKDEHNGILTKLNHHFLHTIQASTYPFQPSSEQYELIASIAAVVDYLVWVGRGSERDPLRLHYAEEVQGGSLSEALDNCYRLIASQERELSNALLSRLTSIPGVAILGDPHAHDTRAPTVAFAFSGGYGIPAKKSKIIHQHLVQSGRIGAQVGHMYAYALISSVPSMLNVDDGVLRVSFVHYNSLQEVQTVCEAIHDAIRA